MTTRMNAEQDQKLRILNSFLTTPHRDISKLYQMHKDVLDQDPDFYGKLAVWYWKNGTVRDHQDLFTGVLVSSSFPGHRDAGLYFIRELDPYRIARVVAFYRDHIKKSVPKALQTEGRYIWWERENDQSRLDGSLLHARKDMRHFIKWLRIPHSEYTDMILFEDHPPEGSVFANLKSIAAESNPTTQARMIIENKVPFRLAASILKGFTPTALVALVEGMSPQDVANNLATLKKRGAFDNPSLKSLVERKIKDGKKNKNFQALKGKEAKKAAGLSAGDSIAKAIDEVADKRLKDQGRIKRPTALLVDKSGSLAVSLEVAKQLGAMISTVMEDGVPLHVISFDVSPKPIRVGGEGKLADWEEAFSHVKAGGLTSCGSGVRWLARKTDANPNGIYVEQIILITDEAENRPPHFVQAYQEYAKQMNVSPHVFIVRVGEAPLRIVSVQCDKAGIENDVFAPQLEQDKVKGDYYSFPNLISMLKKGSKLDLLMSVEDEELPKRKPPVEMPQSVRDWQLVEDKKAYKKSLRARA